MYDIRTDDERYADEVTNYYDGLVDAHTEKDAAEHPRPSGYRVPGKGQVLHRKGSKGHAEARQYARAKARRKAWRSMPFEERVERVRQKVEEAAPTFKSKVKDFAKSEGVSTLKDIRRMVATAGTTAAGAFALSKMKPKEKSLLQQIRKMPTGHKALAGAGAALLTAGLVASARED